MFLSRADAGRRLGVELGRLEGADPVVVGLPRGGVPVAAEIARALSSALDVIVVRKLGAPGRPELGMGAVGEGGVLVLNDEVLRRTRVSATELEDVLRRERAAVEATAERLRGRHRRISLRDRTVIVVDDGVATGSTARAAIEVARAEGARRLVLAVPVAPADWTSRLGGNADELICLETPSAFWAVGQFYEDFSPVSDEQVSAILDTVVPPP